MTYAHNLREALSCLETLYTVYPCHGTEERVVMLRLAWEEFKELTEVKQCS